MEENIVEPSNDLLLNDNVKTHFYDTAKWAKFLGIMGFVMCGLMIIGSFTLKGLLSSGELDTLPQGAGSIKAMAPFMSAIYILFAVVGIIPCFFMFKFGSEMKLALKNNNQVLLENASKNLNRLFKFYAIISIVVLAIYFLAGLAAGLGAAIGGR